MALQKEIWLTSIVENLFPDNSFASKSVDDSAFVNNKTVHIPNAGSPSGVKTNRSSLPASISKREDHDLSYKMDELTTDPIMIPHIDTVQLSYDKRESVISTDRAQLVNSAHLNLLKRWGEGAQGNVYYTTGEEVDAHTSDTATGKRKAITRADVKKLMTKFDKDDVPQTDRFILLDAEMYAQFFTDLTESDKQAFLSCADAKKGIVGEYAGFQFMKRSRVLRLNTSKKVLDWDSEGVAGELAAGFAWQKSCVSRALGKVDMFENIGDPTYYADIYSFLVMTGGACRRQDKKGVALLAEAAV